jgi:hypothetical protein
MKEYIDEIFKYSFLVRFPANTIGGNHVHERVEKFIALGELKLFYKEGSEIKEENMYEPDKGLKVITVESMTEHAVKNETHAIQFLLEFADQEFTNAEKINLI